MINEACSLAIAHPPFQYANEAKRYLFNRPVNAESDEAEVMDIPCVLSNGTRVFLRREPSTASSVLQSATYQSLSTAHLSTPLLLSKSMEVLNAEADSLRQQYSKRFLASATEAEDSNQASNLHAVKHQSPLPKSPISSVTTAAADKTLWVEKYTPKSFSQVRLRTHSYLLSLPSRLLCK